ncbi:MAG TPA: hypothetical protein VM260_12195 [Pirellula sp.]|nr:hypothetical protein [Pirellula sp.]
MNKLVFNARLLFTTREVLNMEFEKSTEALLPEKGYYARVVGSVGSASIIVVFSLLLGSTGYAYFGALEWADAILNAAMILTGMGPVDRMNTTAGKLFATFYALYSGIAFLSMMGIIVAPILHRFLHRFHLEED